MTDTVVIFSVLNLEERREYKRDDITVPIQIVNEIYPRLDTSKPSEMCIIGQDAPRRLSGRPNDMNDMYMTIKSSVDTMREDVSLSLKKRKGLPEKSLFK